MGMYVVQLLWKWVVSPSDVHMDLPYDPAVPLLGMFPREKKSCMSTQRLVMVIAALHIMAEKRR